MPFVKKWLFSKENAFLLLDRIHRLPATESTGVDVPYKQAYILYKAGVKFAFAIKEMGSYGTT